MVPMSFLAVPSWGAVLSVNCISTCRLNLMYPWRLYSMAYIFILFDGDYFYV